MTPTIYCLGGWAAVIEKELIMAKQANNLPLFAHTPKTDTLCYL